jgi:hypothetical protein
MSGTLASFLGQASAAGNLISTLFGASGAVTLGTITFTSWEVPQKITFGGKQRLAIHKLPGGIRVIDAMGRDDMPLSWSGIIQGAGATARAQQIDALRIAGKQVPLTWGGLSYTVVIASFEVDFTKPYWMPYRISCEIVAVATGAQAGTPSLLTSVTNDLSSATGINISAAYSGVASALATAQATVGPLTAILGGSSATAKLLGNLSGAATQVQSGISAAGALLSAVPANVGNLSSLTSTAGDLAGLSAIGGFVQRAAANVAAA